MRTIFNILNNKCVNMIDYKIKIYFFPIKARRLYIHTIYIILTCRI